MERLLLKLDQIDTQLSCTTDPFQRMRLLKEKVRVLRALICAYARAAGLSRAEVAKLVPPLPRELVAIDR